MDCRHVHKAHFSEITCHLPHVLHALGRRHPIGQLVDEAVLDPASRSRLEDEVMTTRVPARLALAPGNPIECLALCGLQDRHVDRRSRFARFGGFTSMLRRLLFQRQIALLHPVRCPRFGSALLPPGKVIGCGSKLMFFAKTLVPVDSAGKGAPLLRIAVNVGADVRDVAEVISFSSLFPLNVISMPKRRSRSPLLALDIAVMVLDRSLRIRVARVGLVIGPARYSDLADRRQQQGRYAKICGVSIESYQRGWRPPVDTGRTVRRPRSDLVLVSGAAAMPGPDKGAIEGLLFLDLSGHAQRFKRLREERMIHWHFPLSPGDNCLMRAGNKPRPRANKNFGCQPQFAFRKPRPGAGGPCSDRSQSATRPHVADYATHRSARTPCERLHPFAVIRLLRYFFPPYAGGGLLSFLLVLCSREPAYPVTCP
jgi:hypothetical protein